MNRRCVARVFGIAYVVVVQFLIYLYIPVEDWEDYTRGGRFFHHHVELYIHPTVKLPLSASIYGRFYRTLVLLMNFFVFVFFFLHLLIVRSIFLI